MLNEKAVKEFFLEVYENLEGDNSRPAKLPEIIHSKILSDSREYKGVYLFYRNIWFEEEDENQNIIQKLGSIAVSSIKRTLWTMNYDGWQEKDEQVTSLRKEGLRKSFKEVDRQWQQTVLLEKNGLKYKNKISGSFVLFNLEETITNYFRCVSYNHYRGRALVNLSV